MAYDSVELSQMWRWGLSQGDTGNAARWRKDGEEDERKRGKERSTEISFHLFNYLSAIWHRWAAILQLHCDESVYMCGDKTGTRASIA